MECVDTVFGSAGRRARWHEFLSLFDLHVSYLPGKNNTVADALHRWAYPPSESLKVPTSMVRSRTATSESSGSKKKKRHLDVSACNALLNGMHYRVMTSRHSPMILDLISSHNSVSWHFRKQHGNLYMTAQSILKILPIFGALNRKNMPLESQKLPFGYFLTKVTFGP